MYISEALRSAFEKWRSGGVWSEGGFSDFLAVLELKSTQSE
jgi:hypothetical protein